MNVNSTRDQVEMYPTMFPLCRHVFGIGLCLGCSTMLLVVVRLCGFLTAVRISAIYIKPELMFAGQRYVIERGEVAENASDYGSDVPQQLTGSSTTNDEETYRERRVLPRQFTTLHKYDVTNIKPINRNPSTFRLTSARRYNGYEKNMNEANRYSAHNGKNAAYFPRINDRLPFDTDQRKWLPPLSNEQAKQGIDVKHLPRFRNGYDNSISQVSSPRDIFGHVALTQYHIQPAYNGLVTNTRHIGNVIRNTDTVLSEDYYPSVIPNVRDILDYRDERMQQFSPNFDGSEGTEHHSRVPSIGFQMDIGTARRRHTKSGVFYRNENHGMSNILAY